MHALANATEKWLFIEFIWVYIDKIVIYIYKQPYPSTTLNFPVTFHT